MSTLKKVLKKNRRVYIETLGCQMNKSDSELMLGLLKQQGFEPVTEQDQADLLIINTCQIRGSAEDKAYSYVGRWAQYKKQRPQVKIAMAGCVSQQAKDSIFKRAPYIDIVFGTQNIHELPQLVEQAFETNVPVLAVSRQKPRSTYDYVTDVTPIRQSDLLAWVTIIEGCDYFCTYCVVPYTRGRQVSRPPESILREIQDLADSGFKEVTLLGQTVDAYGKDFADKHHKQYDLADLLEDIQAIDGIERIRFMTSHPLDLSDRIIEAVASLPKVMEYIHIPMQAGDTEILTRMHRGYTAEEYYALVDKLHERIPGVAVSGDYIVGFPGETDEQFQRTVESVARSGIASANTAAYSARAQTPAALFEQRGQAVPEAVKQERLQILNQVIDAQAEKVNRAYQNQLVQVLVEGKSKRNPNRLTGRTRQNKVVNFEAFAANGHPLSEDDLAGQLVDVEITEAFAWSLLGQYRVAADAST